MSDKPLVSVIMNCFNSDQFLREAIDSVYAQTFTDWEIIFWDNASTDRSGEIAQSYDARLKYFRADKTVSLYAARNKALEQCRGGYVAFLDCDDLWVDIKLEKQLQLSRNGPKIIYGAFELIDENADKIERRLPELKSGRITSSLLIKNMISIGAVLIDRDLLSRHKFDPCYNLLGDFDLWVRLSLVEKFYFVPEVVEFSRHHQGNMTKEYKDCWIKEQRQFYRSFIAKEGLMKMPGLAIYIAVREVYNIWAKVKGLLVGEA